MKAPNNISTRIVSVVTTRVWGGHTDTIRIVSLILFEYIRYVLPESGVPIVRSTVQQVTENECKSVNFQEKQKAFLT